MISAGQPPVGFCLESICDQNSPAPRVRRRARLIQYMVAAGGAIIGPLAAFSLTSPLDSFRGLEMLVDSIYTIQAHRRHGYECNPDSLSLNQSTVCLMIDFRFSKRDK